MSVPVVPAGVDQVVEPRWMDGTWGGPIPDAAYEQHCSQCGTVITVYGPPRFEADGFADVHTRCRACGLYSGYSWTWDCPNAEDDDQEDTEYDQAVREYNAAYQERESDAVALQNRPVTCPACRGHGCSACDQGRVPAWAAADVMTLTDDGETTGTSTDHHQVDGTALSGGYVWLLDGKAAPNLDEGFLAGTSRRGKSVSRWPADVDPVECGCCGMRHGRSMTGQHCGWCRGGAKHRFAVALRSRLTRSAPDPEPAATTGASTTRAERS
jgi:hypothetical protein